jgi:hypothetical protein
MDMILRRSRCRSLTTPLVLLMYGTTPVNFNMILVLSYTMHDENSLVRDLVSGAIMAATSVPQLIAYAETTGFSGYRGLTTAGPPYVYTKNCTTTTSSCRRVTDHGGKLKTFVRSYIAALLHVYTSTLDSSV